MSNILQGVDTSGKVKALMVTRNISLSDVATLLTVTDETIRNRFRTGDWHLKELQTIADKYAVQLSDLI